MNYIKPLISVITVCYNSEKTISRTIESILNQRYDNYEYIIIDGQSKDRTLEIAMSYDSLFEGKLTIISEMDSGIYNAMNKGIKLSKGEIIGIVNSDDYYGGNTLNYVQEIYEKECCPNLIIIGNMMRVSHYDEEICTYKYTLKNISNKQCFGHPSMFVARNVYNKIGVYDESYKLAADGEWQYRAHEDNEVKIVLCDKVLNHMREGGASDEWKYRWKWFAERVRMKKEYHKSNIILIYFQELKSVIRCDIKKLVPDKLNHILYSIIKSKRIH